MGVGAYGPSSSAPPNASVKLVIAICLTCNVANATHDVDATTPVVKPLHATTVIDAHAKSLRTVAAAKPLLESTVAVVHSALNSDAVDLAAVTPSFSDEWHESRQLQPK